MNENTPGQEPEDAAPAPSAESAPESVTAPKPSEPAGPPYVLLEKLAYELLEDQRMNRRWRVFFRFSALILALIAIWAAFDF